MFCCSRSTLPAPSHFHFHMLSIDQHSLLARTCVVNINTLDGRQPCRRGGRYRNFRHRRYSSLMLVSAQGDSGIDAGEYLASQPVVRSSLGFLLRTIPLHHYSLSSTSLKKGYPFSHSPSGCWGASYLNYSSISRLLVCFLLRTIPSSSHYHISANPSHHFPHTLSKQAGPFYSRPPDWFCSG